MLGLETMPFPEAIMLFSRRRNNFAIAALIVYAGALVAAMTLFAFHQFFRTEIEEARQAAAAAVATERRSGIVMIPGKLAGRCRRLEFDNITGALREGATGPCRDSATAGNSTQGRMSAIRESFANH
jgi:hypothetical protein